MTVTELPTETRKERQVPDGLIEFVHLPIGTLTQAGEPRKEEWRRYYFRRTCDECDGVGRLPGAKGPLSRKCSRCKATGKRRDEMTSVSTIKDAITAAAGLVPWAEAAGIKGCLNAAAAGEVVPGMDSPDGAVRKVRYLKLGADAARKEASDRGIDIHALLEDYNRTGKAPNPADFPPDRHGYIQALTRWLLATDPEPVSIEELVCSPEDSYAGRLDLIARVDGKLVAFDAKTNAKGQIFDSAHVQLRLYIKAHVRCGGECPEEAKVVVFAANGEFREMDCAPIDVGKALLWYRELRPVTSACESANRIEREARKAA